MIQKLAGDQAAGICELLNHHTRYSIILVSLMSAKFAQAVAAE